jgi:hypothetical protein
MLLYIVSNKIWVFLDLYFCIAFLREFSKTHASSVAYVGEAQGLKKYFCWFSVLAVFVNFNNSGHFT